MSKKFYGWYVVLINALIGCAISTGFPQSSMTIPYLSKATQISQEALLFGDTIRTIGIIISMMISGFVYKKLGARKTFLIGMILLIPPIVIIPYIKSLVVIYLLKFMQGMSVVIFPMFLIIIMDWIEEQNRGISTAIFNGIFYGGAGIGGTFSGLIIANFGWIESYWALAIVQLVLAAIWLLTVKENKTNKTVEQNDTGERKKPVSFGQMIKMPILWMLVIGFISTTWSVQAISVDMPLFASYLGYDEIETGKILSAITLGILSACIVSGKAGDFFASKSENKGIARVNVFSIGCIIVIVSVTMLLLLDLTKFAVFYFTVLVFSFGASWGLGSFYSILPEIFDNETLPFATGFIGGCGDAGMTLAPVAVGIVFGIKGYWTIGWGLCIVVAIFSVLACLMIVNNIRRTKRG